MTKEEFKQFIDKENEIYEKYSDCKDPQAYELLRKEWLEFIVNFKVHPFGQDRS